MQIRNTAPSDIDEVMEIYALARSFMRASGNADQWGNGHPPRELIEDDIRRKKAFSVIENDEIVGVFFFDIGIDPTYLKIYEGSWDNNDEYGVIHRIAVKYQGRGIANFVYDYCNDKVMNLRIDTHRDNLPMRRSLTKNGFHYCGIIYLESGDERLAYQRVR